MAKDKKKKKMNWEDRPPTLDLRGKNFFPEISNMQIDDVVELVVQAKLTRKEEGSYPEMAIGCCGCDDEDCGDDHEENKKKMSATFQIQSIKSNGKVSKANGAEGSVASKFNSLRKKGYNPTQAMNLAKNK